MSLPRIGRYLISHRDLSFGWMALYGATFALELPCALLRGMVIFIPLYLGCLILGAPTAIANPVAVLIAYGPLLVSLFTLLDPFGSVFWEQAIGGRAPSEREQLIYEDALEQLRAADPELRPPRRWFVLDEPEVNAAAYADCMMITRGCLESLYAPAVIAHELGHLNSADARLSAALSRMSTPPRGEVRHGFKTLAFFATGAAAMWPLRGMWSAYWRSREHRADAYAQSLGQGELMEGFLDQHVLDDIPVPYRWLSDQSHPPTEHRLERLMRG